MSDLLTGTELRDLGTTLVLENDGGFKVHAMDVLVRLACELDEFTSDELRDRISIAPNHVNAFGAVFLRAAKLGYIERTDKLRKSRRKEAHAHSNPIWRSKLKGRAA